MTETVKEIRKTITSIFMVPTLNIGRDRLNNVGYINGFVRDEIRGIEYKDSIYLLFRPSDLDKFRNFLDEEYERAVNIIADYDYPDGFIVVVYKLDMSLRDDFNLIRQGKYSKTSSAFQSKFPRVVKIMVNGLHRDELSLQCRIFKKTTDLVEFWEKEFDMNFDPEQEVWHGFDENNEVLTQEKLNEYL